MTGPYRCDLLVELSEAHTEKWRGLLEQITAARLSVAIQAASPITDDRDYATRIRQQQKRLDENEIERLIAEYRTGLTVYQLATRFGCHRTTVSECLKARGIQMRRRPLCEEQITEAIRLYQSGLSVAKVADQVGAKSETVRLRLIERGVQMRDSRGLARKHQDSTAEKTQLPKER